MKTSFGLTALLLACLFLVCDGRAEDKKKDKVAEWQKQQFEQQQKIQQWKLQQMQQQQPQPQRGRVPQSQVAPQNGVAVRLAVLNLTGAPVHLLWVSAPGRTQSFGTINPAQPGDQPVIFDTFAGHTWHFRVGRNLIKAHTMTTQRVQQVVLGDPAIANRPAAGGGVVIDSLPAGPTPVDARGAINPQPADAGQGGAVTINASDPAVVEFLRVHNQARAEVGVPPLKWSDKLARAAQDWAVQIAATGQIVHNPKTPFGENIAGGSPPFDPAAGANSWLKERVAFRSGIRDFSSVGHYTQMVWRGTTHVGFGTVQVNGMTVVVANYEPAGNISGQQPF
jgi:hypothetical protein